MVERRCHFSRRQALAKRYGRIVVTIAGEVPCRDACRGADATVRPGYGACFAGVSWVGYGTGGRTGAGRLDHDRTGVGVYPDWHDVGWRYRRGEMIPCHRAGWCRKPVAGSAISAGATIVAPQGDASSAPGRPGAIDEASGLTARRRRYCRSRRAVARRCGPLAVHCPDSRSSRADRSPLRAIE
jgi:hypothetical protein